MRGWVARQDNIPRGRTIPMGAVPVEARGLRHMVPTYTRRRPGSPFNGRLGSALYAFETAPLGSATLAGEGFATALPVVVGRGSALAFRRWRPGEPTRAGAMSIREPVEDAPVV